LTDATKNKQQKHYRQELAGVLGKTIVVYLNAVN